MTVKIIFCFTLNSKIDNQKKIFYPVNMKKNTFKFFLDLVMSVLLVLMYKKNILTLQFHEIGGIIVCCLFIFHFAINKNWIFAITKIAFKKGTPVKTQISYILDMILLVDTVAILFTGIGINKVTVPQIAFLSGKAISLHLFFGAIFLIFACIHIGLHWNWIKNMIYKKQMPKPAVIVLSVVLCALAAAGVVNLSKSSMGRWISAPFVSAPAGKHYNDNHFFENENAENSEEKLQTQQGRGQGKTNGQGKRRGMGKGLNRPKITLQSVSTYLFQWITIFVFITALTALAEKLLKKLRKNQTIQK